MKALILTVLLMFAGSVGAQEVYATATYENGSKAKLLNIRGNCPGTMKLVELTPPYGPEVLGCYAPCGSDIWVYTDLNDRSNYIVLKWKDFEITKYWKEHQYCR